MSFGQCTYCKKDIDLEEYNLAKYTNIGNGGCCKECLTKLLKSREQLLTIAILVKQHFDINFNSFFGQSVHVELKKMLDNGIEKAENIGKV